MNVEQFVMAYSVDHDVLRSFLPEGFVSIRPVLRINAEIQDGKEGYLEFNTAVQKDDVKGWLNIAFWYGVDFKRKGEKTTFSTDFLDITFVKTGMLGGCPAEKDNVGCFFLGKETTLRLSDRILMSKEFCDCEFAWLIGESGAHGKSLSKSLPAIPQELKTVYPKRDFTLENIVELPCEQVLGTYYVKFMRKD